MVNFERFIFYSLILLLPTQFGKHFWPDFTIVSGIRIDYLSPITYVTDLLITLLFCVFLVQTFQNLSKFKIKDPRFNIQRKSKRWYLIGISIALFFINNILFSSRPLVSI